ncbi:hypothetical protein DFH08DRAFT_1078336 [Mycena albidolilacea]|uniref:Uncharacterized protein n=1 Tax=Mycena albidolilacea TaxID=1033008 RepID=A0AAD7EUM3_9AGAR|nr:hypothetical protein DFH08DRAFT_1078336 [Mycena albidolilacea]
MSHTLPFSCGTNPIFPTAHSIAQPAAPDGVRPIIATPPTLPSTPAFPPLCAFGPTRLFGTAWRRRPSLLRAATSLARLETPSAMPSSYTTEKASGGVNPPRASLRGVAAPLLALSLWTTRHTRSAFSIIFFGVVQSIPTAILAAFSHTPSFSVHGVVPAIRLSLGTRSHNKPPFNRNSRKYAYVRSGPRHSKPAAAPYRLRCVSCSVTRSDDLCTIRSLSGRAHHVRISSSEAIKNQEGMSSHSRPSLATPPSIQQSRASSDAPDAFSALSTPASLERSIRRAPRPERPLAARGTI